ncbi:MAG: DUF11 domain-containing protein, partial [Micrococcales bacterium]|nr:DUF11 domain-containing protein [Micrococcales bacterium]
GGRAGYTLTVVNAGPSGVAHAVVTVSLPAGFAFDAANSDCTAPATSPVDETAATPRVVGGSGPEFSCLAGALDPSTGQRTGALAAGQSVSFHVVADTDDTLAPGTATATATVGSLTRDVDWSNNTAHADIAIVRLTDLAVSASVSTLTPAAGQAITFTGFAVNNGPSPAVNTTGTTVFPAGFVPVSYDVPYNTCTWSPAAPKDPTAEPWRDIAYTLTCVPQAPPGVDQVWEPGGAATNVVVMYIPRDTPAGSYTGRSTISSDTPEVTLDNNVTTLHLTVDHVADTSVVKTLAGPDPMRAGGPATYRLTVTNHGPSVADNVIVSDTVPSGMTYRSATITGGGACPPPTSDPTDRGDSETTLRCPVGTLAVGRSVTVTVTFGVDENQAGHRICNTAIVGSGALDPDATNNESQACGTAAESIAAASDQRDALAPTGSDVLMLALVVLLVLGTGIVAALASVGRRAPAGVRRR